VDNGENANVGRANITRSAVELTFHPPSALPKPSHVLAAFLVARVSSDGSSVGWGARVTNW
jgi:hypothetical protein